MKKVIYYPAIITLCVLLSNSFAGEKPMTLSDVLQYTPAQLVKEMGYAGEAGENRAAKIWAAAKRSQTNYTLGKNSVQAVLRLEEWRMMLNEWEDLKLQARAIESGGGTMWSHMSIRNDAWIESFLAQHAIQLSAEPKPSDVQFTANYLKTINAKIDAGVNKFGNDTPSIQDQSKLLKKKLQNTYFYLSSLLNTIPSGSVKTAVVDMVKPSDN
ncbi:MAG: hypothetical protein P8O22_00495 [Akkermansiaceae bacterium]|nr:hypothetical protein [Akkermansiaceae bacterium]